MHNLQFGLLPDDIKVASMARGNIVDSRFMVQAANHVEDLLAASDPGSFAELAGQHHPEPVLLKIMMGAIDY